MMMMMMIIIIIYFFTLATIISNRVKEPGRACKPVTSIYLLEIANTIQ